MLVQGQAGPVTAQDGALTTVRLGRLGDTILSELHGRFYEQCFRGNLYCGGISALTSISNATFTTGTLGATETPIIGVWNPSTSTVNLVILQAMLGITITAATATGTGPFVWAASTGNAVITTGNTPVNRKTLAKAGSQAKDMSNVALTGLTTNMAGIFGSALGGGSAEGYSFVGTAAGAQSVLIGSVENFDGSLIVPPGGVLSLLGTTTGVAHSAVSGLLWEEVPIS